MLVSPRIVTWDKDAWRGNEVLIEGSSEVRGRQLRGTLCVRDTNCWRNFQAQQIDIRMRLLTFVWDSDPCWSVCVCGRGRYIHSRAVWEVMKSNWAPYFISIDAEPAHPRTTTNYGFNHRNHGNPNLPKERKLHDGGILLSDRLRSKTRNSQPHDHCRIAGWKRNSKTGDTNTTRIWAELLDQKPESPNSRQQVQACPSDLSWSHQL